MSLLCHLYNKNPLIAKTPTPVHTRVIILKLPSSPAQNNSPHLLIFRGPRQSSFLQEMASGQLTVPTFSARLVPSFEGLKPSAVKFASVGPFKAVSLTQSSFRGLVYTSLKPLGDRVLVKIKTAEEKTQGGILLPTTAQTKPQGGEVVAVGEGRTIGKSHIDISVKTGSQVVYSKYAGTELEFNGSNHLILKEDDILGILETDDVKDLKPLNERVLIKVAEAELKTAGGLLLTEASKEKPSIGTVIAVGPGPLDEEGNRKPLSVSEGNTVMYSKYAGNDFKGSDGLEYIVLRASDVMAVLS
ncbi:20 kDa chaperonin, chloroplastic-like isoform X2 [Rhodamnia argentea]|uniref:20 kDa chaperonin, chloroplastic-like isoform X2 n=1 Tax=Rhodamnia argentea TaxID=178133 RepID=A0ABM3HCL6_9MYRT|nr:20 kDa chaperonin, chloroplastic-like isoform X2 [Rhodamnia argentea]